MVETPPQAKVAVCGSKCWPCHLDRHFDPPQLHIWADDEDIAAAQASGQDISREICACPCANPHQEAA